MALKDIAINLKITGVEPTTVGMKTVENAAESMGRKVNGVTASSADSMTRLVKAAGDASTATAQMGSKVEDVATKGAAALHEMHGAAHGAHNGMTDLEKGIHSVVMRVMNLTMAAALIAAPFVAFFALMKHGITIVDEFEVSVLQIAAQLTQMQAGRGNNLGKTFQEASGYAQVMAEKLEEIDANSFANNKGLMAMLQTMTMQGTVLDVNNQKQVETFTSLSNAIAMYTAGQDQEIQARQEMRALLSGEVNQHSQLARIIDTQIKQEGIYKGGLKEIVELGQEHHDTLERLSPYLVGINAASESINKTWSAASSSLETAVNKVTRDGFTETFHEVVPLVSELAAWLKGSSVASDTIHKIWLAGKGVITAVADLLQGPLWVVLVGIGGLTQKVLNGWGLILSSVLPVLTDEFRHLLSFLNAMVNLAMAFGDTMLDAVGAVGSSLLSVGKAALQALTGDFDGASKTLQGMFSGVYVDRFRENMVVVKGTIIAMKEEWAAMQDPIGRMLDKADQYLSKTHKAKLSVTAPPPLTDPSTDASTINLEAYEREVEKFREAYRALNHAYDKAAIEDSKRDTALRLAELKNWHAQGLVSEQQFLDAKYQLDVAETNKDIALLMSSAERAQSALDSAASTLASKTRPADGSAVEEVQSYNNAVLNRVKAEKELVDAMDKVSAAVAHAKRTETEYAGASRLNELQTARMIQDLEIQKLEAQGNALVAEESRNLLKYYDIWKKTHDPEIVARAREIDDIKEANRLYAEQVSIRNTISGLSAANAAEAAGMVGVNANTGTIDSIADQTAHDLAVQEQAHARRLEMIDQERQAAMDAYALSSRSAADYAKVVGILAEKEKERALAERDNSLKVTKIAKDSFRSQLSEAGNYTSMAGQLFSALASTQNETSREGFENAKAFSISAAVMSTAAAVMNALATMPWPISLAAAALAAATGAIQIAKIASTSFGDAGSVAAPAGSFGGGTGVSATGGRFTGAAELTPGGSHTERSLAEALQELTIASRANTGAITTMTELIAVTPAKDSTIFKHSAPGQFTSLSSEKGVLSQTWKDMTLGTGNALVSLLNPVAWAVGGLSMIAHAFGFGNSWKTTGAGISAGIRGGEFSGADYVDQHKSGGWFTSSKNKTIYGALDPAVASWFQGQVNVIKSNVTTAAQLLGTTTTDLSQVVIGSTKIATAGRSIEDIQKDVDTWVTNITSDFAKTIKGLDEFTRAGETAGEAYQRLANSALAVRDVFELTGNSMQVMTLKGADLASILVEAYGDADKLKKANEDFVDAVYTPAAAKAYKAAAATQLVNAAFAGIGITVPKTNDELIKLRQGLDTSTEEGMAMWKVLTDIGPAFATATDSMKSFLDEQRLLDQDAISKTMKYSDTLSQYVDLYDLQISQARALRDAIAQGLDVTQLQIAQQMEWGDAVKKATQTASEAQKKLLDDSKALLTSALSVSQTILGTLRNMLASGASPELAYLQAKADFAQADASNVSARATALDAASKAYNASGIGYQQDRADIIAKLGQLSETAPTVSDVDRQIAILTDIQKAITAGDTAMVAALGVTFNAAQIDMGTANNALTQALSAIQQTLNTPITAGTARPAIEDQIGKLQASLNSSVTGSAKDSINTAIGLLQASLNGTISASTAQAGINLAYSVTQGALNGTISGTFAASSLATTYAITQAALNGTISPTAATQALNTAYGAVQGALNGTITSATATAAINTTYGAIQGAVNSKISATDATTYIGQTYSAVKGALEGKISSTAATTAITATYNDVQTALGNGLTTGTNSVSGAIDKFNAALAASAKTTSDSLTKFINALGALDQFASAKTNYSATITGLNEKYRAGTISVADYAAQAAAAYAPVSSAFSSLTANGVTTVANLPAYALTAADIDARMKPVAYQLAKIGGWFQTHFGIAPDNTAIFTPYVADYDLNRDGKLTSADQAGWTDIANGFKTFSSFGVPAFASGGHYTGGSALMGEYGPELVDSAPGYVYRADETRALFAMARRGVAADNYGSNDSALAALIAEVKELRKEVAELRRESARHGEAGVRVASSGFARVIAIGESQADSMRTMASSKRRATAE